MRIKTGQNINDTEITAMGCDACGAKITEGEVISDESGFDVHISCAWKEIFPEVQARLPEIKTRILARKAS